MFFQTFNLLIYLNCAVGTLLVGNERVTPSRKIVDQVKSLLLQVEVPYERDTISQHMKQ